MPPVIRLLDSGSLDSCAARVVLERAVSGTAVEVVHVSTGFVRADKEAAAERQTVEVIDAARRFAREVALPQAQRDAGPRCVECRAFALRQADPAGREWLATGEVLGQHPISQSRRALEAVERLAGASGRVLRPLSALHLPRCAPEAAGAVDRRALAALHGRGRAAQRALVAPLGSVLLPQPGGKCCELCDPAVFRRLRDLAAHDDPSDDVALVRTGRHFRIAHDARVVVARDAREGERLDRIADQRYLRVRVAEGNGATCVLACADPDELCVGRAAALAARFARGSEERDVGVWRGGERRTVRARPANPEQVDTWRL